jgi:CHASE2 domain-containing sensor protein
MSLEKISKNKPLLSVILAVIIFIIVFSFHNIFYSIDKKIQNKILSYKTFGVSKDIIVLEIDENTLKKLGRFPFNRNIYTDLIENLENA